MIQRWSEYIQAVLWELRPRMRPDADPQRLARFIIASLEGALLMSRVSRELCVLEGIAADLKRFVGMHLTENSGVADSAVPPAGSSDSNILV